MSENLLTPHPQAHPFWADDDVPEYCRVCQLPEANERHHTMQRIHARVDKAYDEAVAQIKQAIHDAGQLAFLAFVTRVKSFDPLAHYAEFQIGEAYDKGRTWTTTDLQALYREDGSPALWPDTEEAVAGEPMDYETDVAELDQWSYSFLVDALDIEPDETRTWLLDLSTYDLSKAVLGGLAETTARVKIGEHQEPFRSG